MAKHPKTPPKGLRWHAGERYDIALDTSKLRHLDEGGYRTVVPVWIFDKATGKTLYRRGEGKQIGNFHPVWVNLEGEKVQVEELLRRGAPGGHTRPWSGFGAPKGKKARLSKTFPDMRIVFNIEFEDYNLEEDLASGNPYAKTFLKKFVEGAGWSRIQDEEMATLSKLLGFYCKAIDSESGEVSTGEGWVVQQRFKSAGRKLRTVETLGDVLKLWEAIARKHGGGDDYIYLDQYMNADNFLLFPEGFNGPRYRYGCALGEPCWEDWLEEQGAL